MGKRKRSRLKRAFPKKYASDYVNVQKGINRDVIAAYHNRVMSVSGPNHNVEPMQGNTFMKEIPKTKGVQRSHFIDDGIDTVSNEFNRERFGIKTEAKVPPRVIVEKLLRTWRSERLQGVDEFTTYNKIFEHGDWVIKLFFKGTRYVWVEERYGIARTSIVYSSKARALAAYKDNDICYIKSHSLAAS